MHHEHSMWLKKAEEVSSGQRGNKVMHYVKESIEKLNNFISAPSNASGTIETISSPCTALGAEALPHTPPTKACIPLTRCCCCQWFLISCHLKPDFAQSLAKEPPWQGYKQLWRTWVWDQTFSWQLTGAERGWDRQRSCHHQRSVGGQECWGVHKKLHCFVKGLHFSMVLNYLRGTHVTF